MIDDRIVTVRRWLPGAVCVLCLAGCGEATSPPAAKDTAATTPAPQTSVEGQAAASADPQRPVTGAADTSRSQQNPEANVLFDTLASPDTTPGDWEQAQSRLVELGEHAVPTLVRELGSGDTARRELAASGLATLGPDSAAAAPALQAALRDESIHGRANAATALCAIPEQEGIVIPALAELLISVDPVVRQMSAVNLGNFGEEAAPYVQHLTAVLERAPDDVLVPVVELLGRIGPEAESAAARLQQIAFEQTGDAQQAAQAALERIQEKPAAE
jgi:HEAT repeat protein